jgi:hypothetical protein
MSEESIKIDKRTPEQDACYWEARRIADKLSIVQERDVDEAEFSCIYRATLYKRLMRDLQPICEMRSQQASMTLHVGAAVRFVDGRLEMVPKPLPEKTEVDRTIDAMEARIVLAYTKGLA